MKIIHKMNSYFWDDLPDDLGVYDYFKMYGGIVIAVSLTVFLLLYGES